MVIFRHYAKEDSDKLTMSEEGIKKVEQALQNKYGGRK